MKAIANYIILLILLTIQTCFLYGQSTVTAELKDIFVKKDSTQNDYSKPLKSASNEIDIAVSSGFLMYKLFVSSQDKPSCVFTPSCSEYSVEAFKKKGTLVGWLQTFDRLSRCHGFVNPKHYPLNFKKNLFYDPVQ